MQKLAKQAFSKGWDPLESCSPIVCSEILFRCRREDADIDIQAWFPDMGWSTAGLSLDLVSCLWSQVWECLSYDSEYYLRSAFVNVATEFIKDEMLTLKWFVYIVHSITRFFVIFGTFELLSKTSYDFESDISDMRESLSHQEDETALFDIPMLNLNLKLKSL